MCLDLDELSKCYDKTEEYYERGDGKWHKTKIYSKTKMIKFFKAVVGFECDHTKEEIMENISNNKLRKVWEEHYNN